MYKIRLLHILYNISTNWVKLMETIKFCFTM